MDRDDRQNRDRRPQRQPQTQIVLEHNPPFRFDDGSYIIEATAIVNRGKWTLGEEEINFFLNRNPHREGFNCTNPEGRAFFAFFVPAGQKTAFIEAQIAGTTYRFGVLVNLETTTSAARSTGKFITPSFHADGDDGKYVIADCISKEDGTPMQGVKFQFLIARTGKPVEELSAVSDEDGFCTLRLSFTEAECDITINGPQGFQQALKNLSGPPKNQQRPPIKLETPPLEKQGFWDVLKWGSERRKSWRRGE